MFNRGLERLAEHCVANFKWVERDISFEQKVPVITGRDTKMQSACAQQRLGQLACKLS